MNNNWGLKSIGFKKSPRMQIHGLFFMKVKKYLSISLLLNCVYLLYTQLRKTYILYITDVPSNCTMSFYQVHIIL